MDSLCNFDLLDVANWPIVSSEFCLDFRVNGFCLYHSRAIEKRNERNKEMNEERMNVASDHHPSLSFSLVEQTFFHCTQHGQLMAAFVCCRTDSTIC